MSAAFDMDFDVGFDVGCEVDSEIKIKIKTKPKIKGGGQECPPYTTYSAVAATAFCASTGQHALPNAIA